MSTKSQSLRQEEEVISVILQYQQTGDEELLTSIVLHYENLVESIAKKYSYGKSLYDDVFQVGMLGLLGAIKRYDPSLGKNFEVFAIPTIIGEIKRFLRDKTWDVHVPRRIKELGPKIKSAVELLTVKLQHSPTIPEIADYLDVEVEEVLEAMEIGKNYQALSIDHSIESDTDGSTVTLLDMLGKEDDRFELTNKRIVFSEVIDILSEREKQILQLTFLDQLSQKEAGEMLGISQMHVSRIQRKAIEKLKSAITTNSSVSI
ncbi:RNA polymerase sigma factor SigB [Ureibacillus thermosphaericus]|jgi:RNA polymerase sigma-B factor|uniref:RNA polymerase sigma-B factor n=1 Tax=Ureibacillus thermosphaericus TaxID=51173 RepID=A0A840PV74_URETH|nr:RNA polymerase sigma factor SigB [Ureibacillus thermosphaericus]MBB5149833.1 RNA polymerase sigma-B factor [Ureibacillus thermosphaericus]NKZ32545.1 RNA polymerase sigma factor SigB [Ureibacillus thermosphaericus]